MNIQYSKVGLDSDSPSPGMDGRRSSYRLVAAVFLALMVLRLVGADWVERVEMLGFDASMHLREKLGFALPLDERIAIVGIEPEDLGALDDEFSATAEAIRHMAQLGASVIALDVMHLKAPKADQREIGEAIRDVTGRGVVVVLPAIIQEAGTGGGLRRSLPYARATAGALGVVNADVHLDQLWRGYRMVREAGGEAVPSLALAAHIAYEGVEPAKPAGPRTMVWEVLTSDNEIATARADSTEYLLDFRESYYADKLDAKHGIAGRHWNLRDLAARASGESAGIARDAPLGGKIAFFGYLDQSDLKATTFGHVPGVVLHAQALSDFRQNVRVRRTGEGVDFALLAGVFALALGGGRFVRTPGALVGLTIMGGLVLVVFVLALLWQWQLLVPGVSMAGVWILVNTGESLRRYLGERDLRKRSDAMMSLYFSPSVLEQVRKDPGSRQARRTEAVVLLSDLRNFSAISETCALEEVHDFLNRVFEIQCDEAMAEDGSLSNFAGDQFIAYWGAPKDQADAADRAQRAVQAMIRRLEALRPELKPEIRDLFGYGFALHRGMVLFGNKGASRFLNYTIIGDTVNAVARMESLTKHYRVGLLASGDYSQEVSLAAPRRLIDRIVVTGKSRPLELYQFSEAGHDARAWPPHDEFAAALTLYLEGKFRDAEVAFTALGEMGGDSVCEVLRARCAALAESPPEHWKGAFEFKTK